MNIVMDTVTGTIQSKRWTCLWISDIVTARSKRWTLLWSQTSVTRFTCFWKWQWRSVCSTADSGYLDDSDSDVFDESDGDFLDESDIDVLDDSDSDALDDSDVFDDSENDFLLDALREDIPEGGSDIPERSLAVPFCLRIPEPENIKEKSRRWSEKARRGVSMEKIREAEGVFSWTDRYVAERILWQIRFWTGNQCSCLRMGVACSVWYKIEEKRKPNNSSKKDSTKRQSKIMLQEEAYSQQIIRPQTWRTDSMTVTSSWQHI